MMKPKLYRNETWLREQYHGNRRTIEDMANLAETSTSTIHRWMENHGIERRERAEAIKKNRAAFYTTRAGYEVWSDGKDDSATVHQLLAIANGDDPYVVFDPATNTHHETEIPWDNRPENVVTLSIAEHMAKHTRALTDEQEQKVAELYATGEHSYRSLAEDFGVGKTTIENALKRTA